MTVDDLLEECKQELNQLGVIGMDYKIGDTVKISVYVTENRFILDQYKLEILYT